jgi:hypothetical protein
MVLKAKVPPWYALKRGVAEIVNAKLAFLIEVRNYLWCFFGSGARVRGQSLTKYGRYPIHKEGKIRYSAQHRAKAFDF